MDSNLICLNKETEAFPSAAPLSASMWTPEEEARLKELILRSKKEVNWAGVAVELGKTPDECRSKWESLPKQETVRPLFEITKRTSGETIKWSEEEDKELFRLYKAVGSQWSVIAKALKAKTPNQIKNRFYSTLRRVAIKKREQSNATLPHHPQSKRYLIQYVDDAMEYGHNCTSKRGRKKKKLSKVEQPPEEEPVEFKPFAEPKAITDQESLSAMVQPPVETPPPVKLPPPSAVFFRPFVPAQDSFASTHSSGAGYSTDVSMQVFGRLQELMTAQKQLLRELSTVPVRLPYYPPFGYYQRALYQRPAGFYNGFGGF